jgi:hypothetical protein
MLSIMPLATATAPIAIIGDAYQAHTQAYHSNLDLSSVNKTICACAFERFINA